MKEYMILAPILALFTLGLWITLRSGEVNLTTHDGRRAVLDNLSGMLFRVMGYLAGLFAVQRFIGFPLEIPW
ncbi:MAG: hypothetical protein LC745_04645 [Planctomycetia bacterium]|nr:hypothetical protein [Planctomycetia bacterium]